MEELRQVYHGTPNCFGMVESFYDQYHFTAEIKGIRLTDVNLSLDNGTSDMILELKSKSYSSNRFYQPINRILFPICRTNRFAEWKNCYCMQK